MGAIERKYPPFLLRMSSEDFTAAPTTASGTLCQH